MQDDFPLLVAKVHVVEGHVPLEAGVGDRAVRLVGVLPGPDVGALRALHQVAVSVFFGVDQLHIAVVRLGGGVHQSKTRWAPAMAMTMLLVCWLIWLTGWVAFLFRFKKATRCPKSGRCGRRGPAAPPPRRTAHS